MRPEDTEGMGPVGTNGKKPLATTTNGGIPPRIGKAELTIVEYTIGRGIADDPIRQAWAFYSANGDHLFSVDYERVLSNTRGPGCLLEIERP